MPLPTFAAAFCLAWLLSTRSMTIQCSRQPPVRTLLIDNYDSYTYNIFQLLAETNLAEPRVIYNNAFSSWKECLLHIPAHTYDNVVISPGPGHPATSTDFGICRDCILYSDKPVLGVCLGHQGIVTAYGGVVDRAPRPMHGRLSSVNHDNEGVFKGLPQGFRAVRYHSLTAVRPLPEELLETASTSDGEAVLMGLRHRSREVYGVQFHPESVKTEAGRLIFRNFRDITVNSWKGGNRHGGDGGGSAISAAAREQGTEAAARRPCNSADPNPAPGNCWIEKISPLGLTSEQLFTGLYGPAAASFWLDSALCSGSSRLSFMGSVGGACGGAVAEYRGSNELLLLRGGEAERRQANLFEFIRDEVASCAQLEPTVGGALPSELPFNITRALFGYVGYENRHEAAAILRSGSEGAFDYSSTRHLSYEGSRYVRQQRMQQPPGLLLIPEEYLVYDHLERCAYAVSMREPGAAALVQRVRALEALPPQPPAGESSQGGGALISSETRQQYEDNIHRSLDLISSGETYEVCLTAQFSGQRRGEGEGEEQRHLEAYRQLRSKNPAPLASYFHYNPRRLLPSNSSDCTDSFSILSSSPERFLSCMSNGYLESRPIKGTAKRSADPREDALIAQRLGEDEKAIAENLMVLDLVRNDFGRVCQPGSVTVPRLMEVETYASVHQLVSTVQGRLRPGLGVVDALVATFPGGSMTGAPKTRTMDIIDALEKRPRGVYSGSIGYIGYNGIADLNVVIRTAIFKGLLIDGGVGGGYTDNVTVAGGGAVVALSDPAAEAEEVLLKGRAVAAALGLSLRFRGDE